MNSISSLLVLVAVGGILIVGSIFSIFTTPHCASGALKVTFFDSAPADVPSSAEPLFPGLPAAQ